MQKLRHSHFIFFIIAALICTAVLAGCGGSSAPKGKTAAEIAEESMAKMNDVESYDMELTMNMSMPALGQRMNMEMTGTGVYFANPLKVKMVLDVTSGLLGIGSDVKESMEEYIVQEGDELTLYLKQSSIPQWQKMSFELADLGKVMEMDPAAQTKLFMENLKEAKLEGEETIGSSQTQKIALVVSGELFEKLAEDMNLPGVSQQLDGLVSDMLSQAGDLTYTIWVDKSSSYMMKCAMNLTSFMQNLYQQMAEKSSDEDKVMLEEMARHMSMDMECLINNINSAQDFSLPEETAEAEWMELTP